MGNPLFIAPINSELFFTPTTPTGCFFSGAHLVGPKTSREPRFTSMNLVIHIGLQSQHLPHNLKVWRFYFFSSDPDPDVFFRTIWGVGRLFTLGMKVPKLFNPLQGALWNGKNPMNIHYIRCIWGWLLRGHHPKGTTIFSMSCGLNGVPFQSW